MRCLKLVVFQCCDLTKLSVIVVDKIRKLCQRMNLNGSLHFHDNSVKTVSSNESNRKKITC